MYAVLVEFTLYPEHADAFRRRVRQQAQDSLREEPECHGFDVCVDPQRDHFVLLYEIYTDRKAFDAHLESAHFHDFEDAVRDWVSDRKVATYHSL